LGSLEIVSQINGEGQLTLSFLTLRTRQEVLTVTITDPHGASVEGALLINVNAGLQGDFSGDGEVGFSDFILFAQQFGLQEGNLGFDPTFDLVRDGEIGFADFISFALLFGI
jgi:hypothetical protein